MEKQVSRDRINTSKREKFTEPPTLLSKIRIWEVTFQSSKHDRRRFIPLTESSANKKMRNPCAAEHSVAIKVHHAPPICL